MSDARLQRCSERYAATGGLAAAGVLNQLGRPNIDPLEVLVREAVQNCWDAKRRDSNEVEVELGRLRLDEAARATLTERVLPDPPTGLSLAEALAGEARLFYVADFGTDGLGGPTRADTVRPGEVTDFVDFARNVGQPPDKELGGGSFGYGKTAFHVASEAGTVLVDTLCRHGGRLERRFIALGLGASWHDPSSGPHTGRHWWGVPVDGVPEPATGEDAAELARALGLPEREGEAGLGTTVVVVAPRFGLDEPEDPAEAMRFVAESVAWNFWPRMIGGPTGPRTMRFRVRDGERSVPVPDPRRHPRLAVFAVAMDHLREEDSPRDDPFVVDRTIEIRRPARALGRLVVVREPAAASPAVDRAEPEGAVQTRSGLHHVALMRNAELIVRYLAGPEPVAGRDGYAGAFRCALDVDEVFRSSEPPTHDDWIARSIADRTERSFVNVALRRVGEVCSEVAGQVATPAAAGAEAISLGGFADELATLMPNAVGIGARRQTVTTRPRAIRRPAGSGAGDGGNGSAAAPAKPASGQAPRVHVRERPSPCMVDGRAMLAFPFELRTVGHMVRLRARIDVVTHDGRQAETDPPQGWEPPVVELWRTPAGCMIREAQPITEADGDGTWTAFVALDRQVMLRADITCESS